MTALTLGGWRQTPRKARHRIHAERMGRVAEWIAVGLLVLRGYRILARRWRGRAGGEVDIVAVRGRRLAFVEVKYRADRADAERCVRASQLRRLYAAADAFVTAAPGVAGHDRGFDALYLAPWRWPLMARDHLQPTIGRAIG